MTNQFFFIRQPGLWMFRIFGYGFQYMTYERSRPYFSERNGLRRPLIKTAKWRIFFLKRNVPRPCPNVDSAVKEFLPRGRR